MLYEDGGGDAGVDADHNVLDTLVYIGPWSNMAAQVALQCDQSGCRNYYFFNQVRFCKRTFVMLKHIDFATCLGVKSTYFKITNKHTKCLLDCTSPPISRFF